MSSILLTAMAFRRHGQRQRDLFLQRSLNLIESPHWRAMSEAELLAFLETAHAGGIVGVVAGMDRFTPTVLARLTGLRVISRWGIGVDAVDLPAATERGVLVANTPGLLGDAVADMTFGMMLALARQLVAADKLVRRGGWEELAGVSVWGKSLGIVGLGSAGQAVARRARAFAMTVRVYDPFPNATAASRLGVQLTTLDDLLAESDFVSLHADANPSTHHLMNDATFAKMKPGSFLINTARGALVDDSALLRALESGRLRGVAMDAHSSEPPRPDNPFFQRDDVILTPHIAFSTEEAIAAVNDAVCRNLLDVLDGKRPRFLVNPEAWRE